ncbi:hypothetical protein AC579_965 [Pseudocercospora musae]|uniref:BTB domain-containing protein n=1 Tax=Pseudocercospora musae TaxID=113226 RepID=A0A139IUD7_9PEZI|nr:hypothetical protein AC579_965 [Pseudocercospora musae]KXT18367.1 hypothetical protein AC579_965 [Pseudocercospora musae]
MLRTSLLVRVHCLRSFQHWSIACGTRIRSRNTKASGREVLMFTSLCMWCSARKGHRTLILVRFIPPYCFATLTRHSSIQNSTQKQISNREIGQYKMPARKRNATEMEQSSGSDANITTEDIAPDGDVIFEVGDETRRRLRVSSKILSTVSPVFKTWLGPYFREGQLSRDASNPVTIELPEDQPQAMSDMCNLLHFRRVLELGFINVELGRECERASRVLEFAIVVDKYCCTEALYLQAQSILQYGNHFGEERLPTSRDADTLTAAYLLNQGMLFRKISLDLIMCSTLPLTELRSASHPDILPQGISLVLNLRRNASFATLVDAVELLCDISCYNCDNRDYVHLLRHLTEGLEINRFPIENEARGPSLHWIQKRLRGLDPLKMDARSITCHRYMYHPYEASIPREAFADMADSLDKVSDGLCLQCVREKGLSECLKRCFDPSHIDA